MSSKKAPDNGLGSVKRSLIDKSNTRVVIIVSTAIFAVIFSLVAAKTLWSQAVYQGKVITAKTEAKKQLQADVKVATTLHAAYAAFVGTTTNIIGGTSAGVGEKDGDNAKIILDALPSKYDFPALTTNLEALVQDQQIELTSLNGTDDEIAQSTNTASSDPQAVEIPFTLTVSGDYGKTQALIGALEHSIRPIAVRTLDITGNQGKLTTNISAVTYYQPAKSLNVRTKVVK